MTLTIRDISEARRQDIEALPIPHTAHRRAVLVAVAEQLDLFERRYQERGYHSREFRPLTVTEVEAESVYQAVWQVWEAAYEAAGGVVER